MRIVELIVAPDGQWRVWSVADRSALPPNVPTTEYVALDPVAPDPAIWDLYVNGSFVDDGYIPPPPEPPPVPPPTPVMSRLMFQSRYTVAEQVAIEMASNGASTGFTEEQRATLRVLDRALQNANDVNLLDPRTVSGVTVHVQYGLLTAARGQQILDPAWTPSA